MLSTSVARTARPITGRAARTTTAVALAAAVSLGSSAAALAAVSAPESSPGAARSASSAQAGGTAPGTAQPRAARDATWPCVGEIPTILGASTLVRTSIASASRRTTFIEGRLGYRPKALALLGQSGDAMTSDTVYAAITPKGVLEKIRVSRASWPGRPTKVTWKRAVLSTRFQGVQLITGHVDPLDSDKGYLYAVTSAYGWLNRYTLGAHGLTGQAAVARSGWKPVSSVDHSWTRTEEVGTPGDVLLALHAGTGELFELFVPEATPARPTHHTLGARGWNIFTKVYRTRCDSNRAGLLGITRTGSGRWYNDANILDLSGRDIRNAGVLAPQLSGRPI